MRREIYRKILIILAIIIVLIGMWCLVNLNTSNPVIEGTFVYAG